MSVMSRASRIIRHLTLSTAMLLVAGGAYAETPHGHLSVVTSTGIVRGWALDLDEPRLSNKVHVYVDGPKDGGGVLLGSVWATTHRPALNTTPYDYPGDHGFIFSIRSEQMQDLGLADGNPHSIYAYGFDLAEQTQLLLPGSPKTFTLATIPPHGVLGVFQNGGFSGWAKDLDTPNAAITVEFYADVVGDADIDPTHDNYDGSHFMGSVVANLQRNDVGPHGLKFYVPTPWRDYKLHTISAVAVGNNGERKELDNSGRSRFAFGDGVEVGGVEEVVFDWTKDRCLDLENVPDDPHAEPPRELDIPDFTPRAFRDSSGNIQLISSHFLNLRSIGPDFNSLTRDCNNVLRRSSYDSDPAAYDDHSWISSVYTEDGQTVHAILHNEYRGYHHAQYPSPNPVFCPDGAESGVGERACWMATQTYAVSTDAGASYDQPPDHLVAAEPFTYCQLRKNICETKAYGSRNGRMGMPGGSNIIKIGSHFYALVQMLKFELAQFESNGESAPEGTCLMRTGDLAEPSSWWAWDSSTGDFTMRFKNPQALPGALPPDGCSEDPDPVECSEFLEPDPPEPTPANGRCDAVARVEIGKMAESITRNRCFRDSNNQPRILLVGRSQRKPEISPGVPNEDLPEPPAGWGNRDLSKPVEGYYFSFSVSGDNATAWEPRKIIMEAYFGGANQSSSVFPNAYDADAPDALLYVSLIDHDDTSRNFENSDDRGYIYFTRHHRGKWGVSSGVAVPPDTACCPEPECIPASYEGCGSARSEFDRDLVRLPIRFLDAECPSSGGGGCGLIGIEPIGVIALARWCRRRAAIAEGRGQVPRC